MVIHAPLLAQYGFIQHGFGTKLAFPQAPAIVTAKQVHGIQVSIWPHIQAESDALICQEPGICVGVYTADCVPILLADTRKRVVAAIHAGWRGALAGIVPTCLKAMEQIGCAPEDMVAVIGPCIRAAHYKVDAAFREAFLAQDSGNKVFFTRTTFNLPAYVHAQLSRTHVAHIEDVAMCTYAQDTLFNSYRRNRSPERQLSFIGHQYSF